MLRSHDFTHRNHNYCNKQLQKIPKTYETPKLPLASGEFVRLTSGVVVGLYSDSVESLIWRWGLMKMGELVKMGRIIEIQSGIESYFIEFE